MKGDGFGLSDEFILFVIDSPQFIFEEFLQLIKNSLELFGLIEPIIIFVENDDLSLMILKGDYPLFLELGDVFHDFIFFELIVSIFHIRDGFRIAFG